MKLLRHTKIHGKGIPKKVYMKCVRNEMSIKKIECFEVTGNSAGAGIILCQYYLHAILKQ